MSEASSSRATLRIVTHLARSGGTMISKCLACMPGVALFSEMHPQGMRVARNYHPLHQAVEWHGLLSPAEAAPLAEAGFATLMTAIEARARGRGLSLLLREWAHVDHMPSSYGDSVTGRSALQEELCDRFTLVKAATVRHPLPGWLSLAEVGHPMPLEVYLRGCLTFAEQEAETPTIRYEDFARSPDAVLETLCRALGLAYDPGYRQRWAAYDRITGDNDQGGDIGYRPRRVPREVVEQAKALPDYRRVCALWGYDTY